VIAAGEPMTRVRIMKLTILLVMTVALGAGPAVYYATMPSDDPLADTLQDYGLEPIHPPSNLLQVGSLYLVDAKAGTYTPICDADKTDLENATRTSPSFEISNSLEQKGEFAASVKAAKLFGGDAGEDYVVRIHSSLTDVELTEITLGTNLTIFQKLMAKPTCAAVAMQFVNANRYVCQGQRILTATAQYKLERDARGQLTAHASANDIASAAKMAVETQGNQSLDARQGKWFSGSALQYGVSMNPQCMSPKHARYARVLPQTSLQRAWNSFLFNVLEPMLPPTADPDQVDAPVAGPRVANQ
jgi:hypothetical protein